MLGASTAAQKVYINSSLKSGYVATSMLGHATTASKLKDVMEAINYDTVPITEVFRNKAAVVILDSGLDAVEKEKVLTRLYKHPIYKSLEKFREDMEDRFPDLLDIDLTKIPETERSTNSLNKKLSTLNNDLPPSVKAIKPQYLDTDGEEEEEEEEKTIQPDSNPKSAAEEELEEELPIKAKERLENKLPFQTALTELEVAEALAEYNKLVEEEEEQLYRGTPVVIEPLVPLNTGSKDRRKIGIMNDLVVDALTQYEYSPQLKVEVFEDILAGRYTIEDFITNPQRVIDFYEIEERHGDLKDEEEEEEEVKIVDPTTTTGPRPVTTSATAAGNDVASEIDSKPGDDPVELSEPQEQPLVDKPFRIEIDSGVKRWHPKSLKMFFGSVSNPDWDPELVADIKSLEFTKDEIKWFSNTVVDEYGKKIFVEKRLSDTLEEMIELIQLQYCVMRNLNKGPRFRTATVKLSDLEKIKQAAAASRQGPKIVTAPGEPPGVAPTQPQIITGDGDPVVFTISEAEANFQKAFNSRTTDLDGRPLTIPGTINHTKGIQEGPLPTYNMFAPTNYIDRRLTLRTRRKKIY
ncbi:hypothetical protein BASA81_008358 [Batrachochytrium salamandrivorans]|nr:hypothetical protein BASA81_008358 [Batrachochytrium salamandrivorans]